MRKLKKTFRKFIFNNRVYSINMYFNILHIKYFSWYKQNHDLIKNALISIIFIEVILLRFRLENKTEK